uniref:Astrotactin 2 n=1 Tax=Scleropages formosus TaxID=113540 RepID=A0A8C9SMQ3_SCLFO
MESRAAARSAVLLPLLLVLLLMGSGPAGGKEGRNERDGGTESSPCEVKTVTVSTLPVLRENEFSGGSGESRLLLFVRTDLPGRISVLDDLDNTALPYFTLEMSGLGSELSQVHWKQQWLENGTLFFHVSMSSAEQLHQATEAPARQPAHIPNEHAHLLHVSVMGGLIALLLVILLFALVLYTRNRWCRRRRAPQKSASTEATHEIHYIPSVLLGPQGRDSFRGARLQPHSSVIGVPIRETPILDDCDAEDDEQGGQHFDQLSDGKVEEDFSSQTTHTMDGLERGQENHQFSLDKRGETSTLLDNCMMIRFTEDHQFNATKYLGLRLGRVRGTSLGRAGSEWFVKVCCPHSPVNKATLTVITISACILAVVYGSQLPCPLTVKVILHVPEHFIADGSSFVVSVGSYLDLSNWLNPAKLTLYYQSNTSSQWVQDYCGQRTTDPCEQLCDQETGECSCHEGYSSDPEHKHLCVRTDWGRNEGPWPYTNLEKGYDLVTGEQAPEKIFRSSYSLGQGLWLPVSKSFVVPPVELSINPLASCKTDVLVTEDPGDVRQEAIMSTYFETIDDVLSSFGPVRDCSKDNGGCRKNFKCVSDRRVDSTGCMCPEGLRPMKDGSGCYDYSKGTDCSDGFNGGCEQLCLQQLVPLPDDPSSSNVLMFCGCVQEYRLAADGRSCILQSDVCEGPKCQRGSGGGGMARFNDTLFNEMLHGYNNKTEQVNLGQIFQMTFRDNNFIKDFPQLADGLMVIPLPVEEQCRGVLSEPMPNLQLLTGDAQFSEAMGYPMLQQWRVRSNLYKVKLSAITLSTGTLNADTTRDEMLSFIQQYGSHYVSEALYGSELSCTVYFPSRKAQQQLWLQYQKGLISPPSTTETTDLGSRRELKSMSFITYLSGLLKSTPPPEDPVYGVEVRCEEKGGCPAACHLCRQPGRELPSPTPVLLEVSRAVPLYSLIQDNSTRESATMSSYWCAGKGDVIENWCRCDLSAFSKDGLPNCSPLRQPVLRLASHLEPSSTMVALEWVDVEPLIGYKVSDYIIQHKKVEDPSEAEIYTGEVLSFVDDLLSGLGSSCVVPGRRNNEHPHGSEWSLYIEVPVLTKLLTCDLCPTEIADKVYNLYNGYTSGKEQQTAYNTLMEISPPMLYRVQHHYNSHYEKFGDFVWRSEDELGPRKAHLIMRRVERLSRYCRALLRSAHIQGRTDTVPYVACRSEEARPMEALWRSSLHETRLSCVEKLASVRRNTYSNAKLR